MHEAQTALPLLITGADRLGLHISTEQRARFLRYACLLHAANQQFNLTAVRTFEGIMSTLFLDSLTVLAALPKTVRAQSALRTVDIGSGAGLPGLPLEIMHPDWELTMIESVGKKAAFLQQTAQALDLPHVTVLPQRAEAAGWQQGLREAADLGTARAVAALPALLELLSPLVRSGGLLALPKSGDVQAEIDAAGAAARVLRLELEHVWRVPVDLKLGEGRVVLLYRKTGPTPPGYPRRVGLPKSRPIGS